jgi:hypothetical protein
MNVNMKLQSKLQSGVRITKMTTLSREGNDESTRLNCNTAIIQEDENSGTSIDHDIAVKQR